MLARVPGGARVLWVYRYLRDKAHLSRYKDTEDLFTSYFRTNAFNDFQDGESLSGSGSTIAYTESARRGIEDLIRRLSVRTILDAPCGDYNWFRLIPRSDDLQYIGGDIVEPLVARNRSLFANSNTSFVKLDIIKDPLPAADLWLCRDCFFHFSYKDIFQTLQNFLRSEILFLLTTTYTECLENTDMPTGAFRQINLELPPLSFCQPRLYIDDWVEGWPVRKLGLWDKQTLSDALATNKRLQRANKSRP